MLFDTKNELPKVSRCRNGKEKSVEISLLAHFIINKL
jgi:hypothetical protein